LSCNKNMERKKQTEVVVTERHFIIPQDALVEVDKEVLAQVGEVTLTKTTLTLDTSKIVPISSENTQ